MKKGLLMLPAIALAMTLALPAMADYRHNDRDDRCCESRDKECCPELSIDNASNAQVTNKIATISNTGLNKVAAKKATLNTGDATAVADTTTSANDTKITVKTPAKAKVEIKNNNQANVGNYVLTVSNTGMNAVTATNASNNDRSRYHHDNDDQGATVRTGEAGASSTTLNVVNQTVIKVK